MRALSSGDYASNVPVDLSVVPILILVDWRHHRLRNIRAKFRNRQIHHKIDLSDA